MPGPVNRARAPPAAGPYPQRPPDSVGFPVQSTPATQRSASCLPHPGRLTPAPPGYGRKCFSESRLFSDLVPARPRVTGSAPRGAGDRGSRRAASTRCAAHVGFAGTASPSGSRLTTTPGAETGAIVPSVLPRTPRGPARQRASNACIAANTTQNRRCKCLALVNTQNCRLGRPSCRPTRPPDPWTFTEGSPVPRSADGVLLRHGHRDVPVHLIPAMRTLYERRSVHM